MLVINKRLFFWLIKAYIKKWGRILALSFLGGLIGFFFLIFFSSQFVHLFPQKERVGMVGAYSLDKLPDRITQKISRGLTKLSPSGEIKPDLAESWQVKSGGKTYVFKLKRGIRFDNGTEVTSRTLSYVFKDVTIEKPDKYTIIFHLQDEYAPFLITVSRPIFPRGLQGLGEYTITDIKTNGEFISSLTLSKTTDKRQQVVYVFYPNQEALKTAFLLGEATQIDDIINSKINNTDIATHKNVTVSRQTNYDQLVTLFYNTKDQVVSDNKLRKALSYSLPDSFLQGERAYLPYSPRSIYFSKEAAARSQDLAHAKLLLEAVYLNASESARPQLVITALTKYHTAAVSIARIWQDLGVKVKITDVDVKPTEFQIYLGDFTVPKDPDQYMLWHSDQESNITKFRSLRIDKLLEDGRKTVAIKERKRIYDDFQKYLLDDAVIDTPASFLYFPYTYTLKRR